MSSAERHLRCATPPELCPQGGSERMTSLIVNSVILVGCFAAFVVHLLVQLVREIQDSINDGTTLKTHFSKLSVFISAEEACENIKV